MKRISAKFFDLRSEMKNYRLRSIKFKCPSYGTREDFMYNGSFHEAVGVLLGIAQVFGLMPVSGVRDKSLKNLKLRKFSIRFIFCIAFCISLSWVSVLDIIWIYSSGLVFGKLRAFIFGFSNLISVLCFLELAFKWPILMSKWHEVELCLPQLKYQMDKQKLAYEIKVVSFAIILLGLAEHLLSITVGADFANNCPSIRDPFKAFYVSNFPQVFRVYEYSGALGIFIKTINTMQTFAWNYIDLFVIVISIGLASLFKQINADLLEVKGRSTYPSFWTEYRIYYREVAKLVATVDKAMAKIILLSVSNNLFFICVQLLKSLESQNPSFATGFYFWLSLIYLIGRTLAVSLYAASVNDESKKPLDVFRSVSRHDWCVEVKRFNEEVANDIIALSGMKFFNLTRRLVLSVAGTIITYELVLIQFRQKDEILDYDPCMSRNATARNISLGI